MRRTRSNSRKVISAILAAAMVVSVVPQMPAAEVHAAESSTLTSVVSAAAENNIVTVTFNDGIKAKITFLEDGIFRYNVDPSGEFSEYPAPVWKNETVRITQYPDNYKEYTHPAAAVSEADGFIVIKAGDTTIKFEKETAKMTVLQKDKVVMQESEALQLGAETSQSLVKSEGENFYGGGTQNGRFVHTGESINIKNESNWTDGGVASPNPFYYSSKGYGVLRNTFSDGIYDFGKTDADTVTAVHGEEEYDAYYFLSDGADTTEVVQDILNGYYHVTGNPVLLPEYAFYEGHMNAYNRDTWTESDGTKGWTIYGSKASDGSEGYMTSRKEGGQATGYHFPENTHAESLNGTGATVSTENIADGVDTPYEYSARAVIDQYVDMDMPLGYFLPNDGYGAGYGQNGYYVKGDVNSDACVSVIDANVKNLANFTEYARENGVEVGLWTQSYLTPQENPKEYWHLLRDFNKEVTVGGVTTLKTDVAWVGWGYDMALNAQQTGYNTVTTGANYRANVITLDGWAGTQRFAGIWTGDQYGGDWEYIRFHIPTYIGQSLSGNPNIGSDVDGIFGGDSLITIRDTQWKIFTPLMLNMDGWGSYAKTPYTAGDPYTGINRMYLKLKSQLLPYIYTSAASAANVDTGNDDTGLPMIRAMFLEYPNDEYASAKAMQYQYMFGENFLVAPVYKETEASDIVGNDVRNGIYLPDEDQIWIDYFTGEQYQGGQAVNNFDAPIWKLPLFVKNGAIVPMWEENNNPSSIDKSNRITEFWPDGSTEYTLYEDDGTYVKNTQEKVDGYGTVNDIDYGDHVSTKYTSVVKDGTATLTAEASTGTYEGYDQNKNTTFIVNVSEEPKNVIAKNGNSVLKKVERNSKEAVLNAELKSGEYAYYYDESPEIETYAYDVKNNVNVQRLSGSDRVKTSFAIADEYKNVLSVDQFETVIVATSKNFADALSGNYLAAVKNAPILLTDNGSMNELVQYLKTNLKAGGKVYILGGSGAVSKSLDQLLKNNRFSVQRLEGKSRYETNLAILKEAKGSAKELIVATGSKFADSLSASATNRPILMVGTQLNAAQKAYLSSLKAEKIYIVGGTGAVNESIEKQLKNYSSDVERITGTNRYDTSVNIAKTFFDDVEMVVAASGEKFPDGLCGGALAAKKNIPLILMSDSYTTKAANYMQENSLATGYVLGGDGALKEEAVVDVFGAGKTETYAEEEFAEMMSEQKSTPKLYVKFAETDSQKNAQVLTIEGFVNVDDNLPENKKDADLAAPANLRDVEESKTPTSNTIAWDEVEGALTYDVRVDGVVNSVGNVTSYLHDDQEYHSEHTYQVRARGTNGYSEWSEVVTATTLEDPWRNVPNATITWTGGDEWGALKCATDHDITTMFHSTGDVVTDAVPFIMDFGAGYTLDKFEYYPRDNFGNGTVKRMEVSISLDGIHWNCVADGSETWTYDTSKTVKENVKTVEFNGQGARYVKLVVKESAGNFFSANELALYKADGSEAFAVGSTNNLQAVADGDYTNMKNYLGMSEADGSKFVDQIQKRNGDINYNGVYDVYDYAYTMFKLDGGTKKTGSVSGKVNYEITEKDGNIVIDVIAENVKNLNAFGQVLNYDSEKLTFVSITAGELLKSAKMEDLSVNRIYDGSAYVNLAYANRGDQQLVNGSGVLATITLTPKAGGSAKDIDLSSIMIIGPDFSIATLKTTAGEAGPKTPELSEGNVTKFTGSDVAVTMTNEYLTTDAGSNVASLIQQGSYAGLFDGSKGRDFEFKWDIQGNWDETGALPKQITLPLTMHFALNNEAKVNQISVYNANKANGYVTKAEAVLNYSDGTSSEKQTIELSDLTDYASFDFVWQDSHKTVKSVDVTICKAMKSDGTDVVNMLTLSEIEVRYNDLVPVTGISAEGNVVTIAAGETKAITAVFTPENATNPYFEATSSNPSVAEVVVVADANGYKSYQVKGVSEGTATITLTSLENSNVKVEYTITVTK